MVSKTKTYFNFNTQYILRYYCTEIISTCLTQRSHQLPLQFFKGLLFKYVFCAHEKGSLGNFQHNKEKNNLIKTRYTSERHYIFMSTE